MPDKIIVDRYRESKKENWTAFIGMFLLPIFIFMILLAGYKYITFRQNELSYGPQPGVGGGPPTPKTLPPTTSSKDFVIYKSSFKTGSVNGFISKNLFQADGRVYINVLAVYRQNCVQNGNSTVEEQPVVISKGADTYKEHNTNGVDGYDWSINFNLQRASSLCPQGQANGPVVLENVNGRVYISRDGGVTNIDYRGDAANQIITL